MRGFSLLEIMVVVAVTAVIASVAIVSASRSVSSSAMRTESDHLLTSISRMRASHVAEGRDDPLVMCVDCVDGNGNAKTPTASDTLAFYLAEDELDGSHGRLMGTSTFDLALQVECPAPTGPPAGPPVPTTSVAFDALGRSVASALPRNCVLRFDRKDAVITPTTKDNIVLGGDGRLIPSFAPPIAPEPAHAQNLSSRTTPNPMPRGQFSGDPSRALALPLH